MLNQSPIAADERGVAGTKRRILFVDDEPNVLAGLRRSLRRQREAWEMSFVTGAAEALADMALLPYDVVISDMRMPGMDGAQLLAEVRRRHPQTSRIILSGHADRASIVSSVGPTQQYLAKPCDLDALITTVDRVLAIRDLVTDPQLQAILGGVDSLPKPPRVYEDMIALSADPDSTLTDVVAVVEADVATSTELLRLVNTAFFGMPSRVPSVERAVALLGMDTIQALALAGAVFRSDSPIAHGLDVKAVSDRCLAVATLARRLAQLENWDRAVVADLFLAGLMHQVGLLVLASSHPEPWQEFLATPHHDLEAEDAHEQRLFGCSVSQASAYLLGLWGFSETVIHAIAGQPASLDDLSATPDAQLLAVARRLERYGETGIKPVEGGFVDAERLAKWLDATSSG
jgi:HD-like signal output (HDOD) protein/ActR/RegA family two-component response regulator